MIGPDLQAPIRCTQVDSALFGFVLATLVLYVVSRRMAPRYGTTGQMNKGDDEEDELAGSKSEKKRKAQMVVSDEEEERNNVSTLSARRFNSLGLRCTIKH